MIPVEKENIINLHHTVSHAEDKLYGKENIDRQVREKLSREVAGMLESVISNSLTEGTNRLTGTRTLSGSLFVFTEKELVRLIQANRDDARKKYHKDG